MWDVVFVSLSGGWRGQLAVEQRVRALLSELGVADAN
jgi:hypothetical protein